MKAATHILNLEKIRDEFPILHQEINNHPLAYFDNAATTQKPKRVVRAISDYYYGYNANIHRGIHTLAEKATERFEDTRAEVGRFLNAGDSREIIFTKGTTDSINLVATILSNGRIKTDDEIIVSIAEHHSNFVPWQYMCEKTGAKLKVINLNESGALDLDHFESLLSNRTRLVAVNHASNALGNINDIKTITKLAKDAGAMVLIDGAQAAAHLPIDVQDIGCDFYAVSAHKMYGPTGIGALYGRYEILESLPPYQFGGEMISHVGISGTTYNELPYKYEAGTPNIEGVIGWKEAIEFVNEMGKDRIHEHENYLTAHALDSWTQIPGFKIYGDTTNRVSVISFQLDGIHAFDIGQMLDARGIAVRTGQHCTEPLMDYFCIDGTIRASFAVYNTINEIDRMTDGILKLINFLKK